MDVQHLIRFRDCDGNIVYGNVPEALHFHAGMEAQVLQGNLDSGFRPSSEIRTVIQVRYGMRTSFRFPSLLSSVSCYVRSPHRPSFRALAPITTRMQKRRM